MSVWALLVAAGAGTRMGLEKNKVLLPLGGEAILARSARAFAGEVDGVLIVARPEDVREITALGLNAAITTGGATRQESVLRGLRALPGGVEVVLVHDAARPFVDKGTIRRCIASARAHGSGVASVPAKDTIKQARTDGSIFSTPPRETLYVAQTPQAFRPGELREALEYLLTVGDSVTDDASAMELGGHRVWLVEGAYTNIKITTPEDIALAEGLMGMQDSVRAGHGYDVHRLVENRPLVLCGVTIPYELGLLGHSDADVALHALTDALLGAAALGDIGSHFPDSDPAYKGISSADMLERIANLLAGHGFTVINVDITIIAQRPKLAPYHEEMVRSVAQRLGIAQGCVSVKATTSEGLGFEGEGKGISAHAVAMLRRSVGGPLSGSLLSEESEAGGT